MLHASQVSKRFYTQAVLNRIEFEVKRHESYVVLGQSGVGKSVLLKLLAQLMMPDEGFVRLETRNLGMLFQKNALFDSLTVFENLEFPLRERTNLNSAQRKERVMKFLEWVGLAQSHGNFPDALSGGMQKRLGIARALIVEPELLFYDEPTAGLDPITSRMIADLMLRLKKEMGTTLVIVTSDILRAYQLADQIGILVRSSQGATLLPSGTPDQTRNSQDPRIRQFTLGLTKGPLTNGTANDLKSARDACDELGFQLTERFDVDFF